MTYDDGNKIIEKLSDYLLSRYQTSSETQMRGFSVPIEKEM